MLKGLVLKSIPNFLALNSLYLHSFHEKYLFFKRLLIFITSSEILYRYCPPENRACNYSAKIAYAPIAYQLKLELKFKISAL